MKAYDSAVIGNISPSLPSTLSVSPNYTEYVCTAGMMFSKYTSRFWSFCWPDLFPVSLFRGCFHLLNGTHPMSDWCNDSLPDSVRITVTAVGQHDKENRCVYVWNNSYENYYNVAHSVKSCGSPPCDSQLFTIQMRHDFSNHSWRIKDINKINPASSFYTFLPNKIF